VLIVCDVAVTLKQLGAGTKANIDIARQSANDHDALCAVRVLCSISSFNTE
jgi:hypothetical protein